MDVQVEGRTLNYIPAPLRNPETSEKAFKRAIYKPICRPFWEEK